ncbi:phage head closure protein [Oceanobacillus caeni]|uniref:phage head closure protein n=1 Tax=Virgibacillus sp. SK37 TaxID=403957 RepID=UPI0011A8E9C9|nr:phage head closure protein [Virgibacillus sp. SK37]
MALHFKHRIEIMELKPNAGPEPGEAEVLFSKAWADIKTMKGSEYNNAVMAGNVGKSRFIIRYMKGIRASMKIKYNGLTYDIESITNDDENNHTITMIAKAKLPA